MGLSHVEAELRAASLSPRVSEATKLEAGHKRGQTPRADKTDVGLRGVPVIGHGSGAISNTSPGGELGAAARLERAGREIVAARMRLAREKLKQGAST